MKKIYVAARKIDRAREVMKSLRTEGYEITYDWTINYSEENQSQKALEERNGIREADLVVYLWNDIAESARYEAGMAMGLGKSLIVSAGPDSFFFKLPNVFRVSSDENIITIVKKLASGEVGLKNNL